MKLAYFLPGFHQDECNDLWWGAGFTEWDNIKRCPVLFKGHSPVKLPKDGPYDLSSIDCLKTQFFKIKQCGLDGIMIYDYWSGGVRPLKKIIDTILVNKSLDVNFSICWANHPWSRSWKNKAGSLDILLEQKYQSNDICQFDHYAKIFSDHRYIKINGECLFSIYNPHEIPDVHLFIKNLRNYIKEKINLDLHIAAVVKSPQINLDFLSSFDSVTIGNPTACLFGPSDLIAKPSLKKILLNPNNYIRSLPLGLRKVLYKIQGVFPANYKVFDYQDSINNSIDQYLSLKKSLCIQALNESILSWFAWLNKA